MATKTRSGCQQCRKRHLKCDQATPICGRCQSFGRVCTKNYVYRFHKDKFADDQKWLSTSDDLTFVDETQGSMRARSATLQTTIGTPTSSFGHIGSPISIFSERHTNSDSPAFSQDASPQFTVNDPPTAKDHGDNDGVTVSQNPESPPQHILQDDEDLGPLSPIYLEVPVWPLEKHSEVLLLRHFVQNLAIWLDLCDPQAHFQVVVPQRAGTCRVLLNAIFALSARHLSRTGNYDSFASNIYHQECLRYLIPMLNDTATVSDENLFAATIILRVLEEMDAPETESQSHMLGIQVFVSARDPYAMGGGLSEAAFWVGLRQEIYSALMEQKSVQLNLEHIIVDRSDEPTSDFGWANRAVVLCADVLNCCFGDLGVSSGHWLELKARSDRWEELRPPSFIPVYRRDADRKKREAFPEIWFVHPCQIIGIQHQRLAQILLAIFDPGIPRIGAGRNTAVRLMEEKIKPYLRELCGLGLHNRWTPPGMFTASMGIALCGDRFTDRIDQEALLNILVITEKDHARPTAALQQQMIKAWGWINED